MQQMVPIGHAEVLDFLAWLRLNHPATDVRFLSSETYQQLVVEYHQSSGGTNDAKVRMWMDFRQFVEQHAQQ